jgi:mannose-6-phosphate isomerase
MARAIDLKQIFKLQNTVQHYAWGSTTCIPQLLGIENREKRPFAELWMGSHIKAPSYIQLKEDESISLRELISLHAEAVLGKAVIRVFGSELPFLFKVLAAAAPLSIQVHPSKEQAIAGFTKEEMQAIPLNAANRCYKDANHKPELLVALSPFSLMLGFKPFTAIKKQLSALNCGDRLSAVLAEAEKQKADKRLSSFFTQLMGLSDQERKRITARIADQTEARQEPEYRWLQRLHELYPSDIGVLSPLILNVIELEYGSAVFLPAGVLHSYLEGFGLEIMANSDNVLRCGLTPKHIDVAELLKVVIFQETKPNIILPVKNSAYEVIYEIPVKEFRLSRIMVEPAAPITYSGRKSVEILLIREGRIHLSWLPQHKITARQGESFLIPAVLPEYTVEGQGEIFKAAVGGA